METQPQNSENTENIKKKSIWNLSELLKWYDLGLLPINKNQDIEYYCSFLGAYEIACNFQGVAPLVHGPSGCIESFVATRPYPGNSKKFTPKCLSTDMTLKDIVYGAAGKLGEAILKTDSTLHPNLILILTNCCADIIGEDVEAIAKKVSTTVQADILNIETGGCSGKGFREGADIVFKALFDHVASRTTLPAKGTDPSVNIFTKRLSGRPAEVNEVNELSRLLNKGGIKTNTVIRLGTEYEDLLAIPRGHANISLCYLFGDEPMKYLNTLFNQPYIATTFPIGLKATLEWLGKIQAAVGMEQKDLRDDPEVDRYQKKIDAARQKYEGREAFIWMPGEKGLAMARFAVELGMKPCLFTMSYLAVEELQETLKLLIKDGYDFKTILTGKHEFLKEYQDMDPAERPILFMPRKFWTGDLPTATINCFADSILGLKGIDYLLDSIDNAVKTAGKKDYGLFNRYVEDRYHAKKWDLDGPVVSQVRN
ncbi:MAG: hypothetical protein OEM02_10605 [Desulfobulbaceae bacterium]|nr:hypothetical protein [Desulfobulbaceae bacterium]